MTWLGPVSQTLVVGRDVKHLIESVCLLSLNVVPPIFVSGTGLEIMVRSRRSWICVESTRGRVAWKLASPKPMIVFLCQYLPLSDSLHKNDPQKKITKKNSFFDWKVYLNTLIHDLSRQFLYLSLLQICVCSFNMKEDTPSKSWKSFFFFISIMDLLRNPTICFLHTLLR